MASAAELTEKFLDQYHSIRDCLQRDIVNYAKLARYIMDELDLHGEATEEAVRTAARRYAHQLREESWRTASPVFWRRVRSMYGTR
jgi:hypothetical protein